MKHNHAKPYLLSLALTIFLSLLITNESWAFLDCLTLDGCEKKACEIEREIESARTHHNDHKVQRLKKELVEVKLHCGNAPGVTGLDSDIVKAKQEIVEYRKKIRQKIEKLLQEIDHEKIKSARNSEFEDAVSDVFKAHREMIRDVREEGRDLKEAVRDFQDDVLEEGITVIKPETQAAADGLMREIDSAEQDMSIQETAVKQAVVHFLDDLKDRIDISRHMDDLQEASTDLANEYADHIKQLADLKHFLRIKELAR